MSIKYRFFNAKETTVGGVTTYDREYDSRDLTDYLKRFFTDGVFMEPSTSLRVLAASSGLSVTMQEGAALINGCSIETDAAVSFAIGTAHASLPRIDRVVVRWNLLERKMEFAIKAGTPAATPQAPDLSRTGNVYELSLARVYVPAGASSLTQDRITDERLDSTVCGSVVATVMHVDTTAIFNQYQEALDKVLQDGEAKVSALCIYQEYAQETISRAGQSVVAIDSASIPSFNVSTDILQVYINGERLTPSEYTVGSDSVTLSAALNADNKIMLVCVKSVFGGDADVVALSNQVTELSVNVGRLVKRVYYATGNNDNIALSHLAAAFYTGTGEYANASENDQLKIEIVGTLGVSVPHSGSGTSSSPYVYFATGRPSGSTRKLTLDFHSADRVDITAEGSYATIFGGDRVNVTGLHLYATGAYVNVFNGALTNADDCELYVTAQYDASVSYTGSGTFTDVRTSITSTSGNVFTFRCYGDVVCNVTRGEHYAFTGLSTKEAVCFYIAASQSSAKLLLTNVQALTTARSGFYQTNAIKCNSGYCTACGCILHAPPAFYSTTNCVQYGTIVDT